MPDPVYEGSGASYPRTTVIEEIADKAEVVFVGRVTSIGGLINGARVESDPTRADPNIFLPERQYYVTVDTDITGNSPETLVLLQSEGGSFKIGEETMEEFLAERENLAYPKFAPMETGHTYTFMLRHTPFDSDLWMAAAEPYRFKHVSDGRAFPEGTYSDSGKGVEIVTQTALQSRLEERAGQP